MQKICEIGVDAKPAIRRESKMTVISSLRTSGRLTVQLDNLSAIAAAYGPVVANYVLKVFRQRVLAYFGSGLVLREDAEIEVNLDCAAFQEREDYNLEDFCVVTGQKPVIYGEDAILLSISVWNSDHSAGGEAHNLSTPEHELSGGRAWAQRYKQDMRDAAWLVQQIANENLVEVWRPVRSAVNPAMVLHHEAGFRVCDANGTLRDCAREYEALQRLGLAYLIDYNQVIRTLAELEQYPDCFLAVTVSAQSLEINLLGSQCLWASILVKLRNSPELAARLTLEIAEGCPINSIEAVKVQSGKFRRLGASISVAGFASCQITFGHLMALTPNIVKISPVFLRSAALGEVHEQRMRLLINLALTMAKSVVIDGVDGEPHMQLARSIGAEWVAGSSVGEPALWRAWRYASVPVRYEDSLASISQAANFDWENKRLADR